MHNSFRLSAFAAILTLAALIWMRYAPGDLVAAELPPGFRQPIIAFEFADPSIIHRLFFEAGGLLKASFVQNMKAVNYRDFAFMAGYGLFLFFFAQKNRNMPGFPAIPALALACCAPVADLFENMQLLGILDKLPNEQTIGTELALLKIFTWIKWLALAVYPVLLVPALVRAGLTGRLAAFAFVLCLLVGLAAMVMYTPFLLTLFTTLVMFALGGMMMYAMFNRYKEVTTNRSESN
jgi:hypothetical protein